MKSLIAVLLLAAVSVSAQTIAIPDRDVAFPAIAASRTRVLTTWLSQEQLRAELIDFNGHVIAGPFTLPCSCGAAIVSDGERFLVYWSDGTNVEGTFIDPDGTVGPPFTIVPGATSATATFDGTRYLFFTSDGSSIHVTPLTVHGIPERRFTIAVANATVGGAASHDGVTALTWVEHVENQLLQAGLTFIDGGIPQPPITLATMQPNAGFGGPFIWPPFIAWNGSTWLAIWQSGRSGRADNIEGTRVTPYGSVLDVSGPGDGFHAGGISFDAQIYTDVEHSSIGLLTVGSQFLVVWTSTLSGQSQSVGQYFAGARIPLSYGVSGAFALATTVLPNGTLVSLLQNQSGDLFVRFGRVARRRVSR